MTISTTIPKVIYAGNGIQTVFPFSFPVQTVDQLAVYYTDTSGNVSLLPPANYTISLNPLGTNPAYSTGSITYNPGGTPIASGTSLTIARMVSLQQLTRLVNQNGYFPNSVEGGMDYLMLAVQQLNDGVSRSIRTGIADSSLATLPSPTARANTFVGFDSNGNLVVLPLPISGTFIPSIISDYNLAGGSLAVSLPSPYAYGNKQMLEYWKVDSSSNTLSISGTFLGFSSPIVLSLQGAALRLRVDLSTSSYRVI